MARINRILNITLAILIGIILLIVTLGIVGNIIEQNNQAQQPIVFTEESSEIDEIEESTSLHTEATQVTEVTVSVRQTILEKCYDLAYEKYGINKYNVNKTLKLMAREGYSADGALNYYMACTCINRLIEWPECELYSYWGGGDTTYNEYSLDGVLVEDIYCYGLYEALQWLDEDAWDIHGMVPENGEFEGYQHLDEAMYISYTYGYAIAVWDRYAGWYEE